MMRVLIADDSDTVRAHLRTTLTSRGFDVEEAADGYEAWRILQREGAPQLAILDWMMPGLTGLQLCERVKSQNGRPYTYIILVTARSGVKELAIGLGSGADDYLKKPFVVEELESRLLVGYRNVVLHRGMEDLRRELWQLSVRDSLTGLLNRRGIEEVLAREVLRRRRVPRPLSIAVADIDFFKEINDRYGHPAGDEVIREVARRIETTLRSADAVGRFGGEEFLIILPEANADVAVEVSQRIRRAVNGLPVETPEGAIETFLSVGVATAMDDLNEWESLVSLADGALYQAKNNGRNRVVSAGEIPTAEQVSDFPFQTLH